MSSKSSYSVLSKDGFNSRVSSLKDSLKEAKKNVENLHVNFSAGNTKVGCIPSVSTLPVVDCVNCKACKASCYDLRHDLIYKTVRNSRAINSAIYAADPERYFREIDAWLTLNFPRAFRWHIGGDIKGAEYLAGMVRIADSHPDVKFLAFTKAFDVVNKWLDDGNTIPINLHIIFSGWKGQKMPNPYNFPSSHPLFVDGTTSAHDGAKLCTGNCSECFREDRLCWNMKPGEEVIFVAH